MRPLAALLALLVIVGATLCPADPVVPHSSHSVLASHDSHHAHGEIDDFLSADARRERDLAGPAPSTRGWQSVLPDVARMPAPFVPAAPPGATLVLNAPLRL